MFNRLLTATLLFGLASTFTVSQVAHAQMHVPSHDQKQQRARLGTLLAEINTDYLKMDETSVRARATELRLFEGFMINQAVRRFMTLKHPLVVGDGVLTDGRYFGEVRGLSRDRETLSVELSSQPGELHTYKRETLLRQTDASGGFRPGDRVRIAGRVYGSSNGTIERLFEGGIAQVEFDGTPEYLYPVALSRLSRAE